MPRALKRVGFAALAIALASVLGLVREHVRGRRQLEATLAELKAAGTYPDSAILFAPPGPRNGLRTFEQAMRGLSSCPGPDPMKGIAPGRAAPSFLESQWRSSDGRTNTWDSLADWRRDVTPDLELLHVALAEPECRTSVDWRLGFKAPLPMLARYKQGARALGAAALLAARNGNKTEALQHLEDLRRLESALASERLLVSQLVRIASASIGLFTAWDLAQRADWTEADLAALQATLSSTNSRLSIVECLRGETVLWEATILARDFSQNSILSDPSAWLQSPMLSPSALDEVPGYISELFERTRIRLRTTFIDPLWRYAWRDQALAMHLRAMKELVNRARSAVESRNLKSFSTVGILPDRKLGWYEGLRLKPTVITLGSLYPAVPRALSLETQRTLIETQVALRRYSLRYGQAPERLDQLVPEFLSAIPMDSMVGEPLHFRRNPDGTTTLWSVGEDFKDDGGTSGAPRPGLTQFQWWKGDDMVVPAAADATEYAAWKSAAKQNLGNYGGFKMDPALARRYGLLPKDSAATNAPAPK